MTDKFFLFKRDSPSKESQLFSDNGKGISVMAIPASSVSYMVATEGSINIFFNNTSVFEENSLKENESFEKTKVIIRCAKGVENDLIESIVNFMNKNTPKNVMKFDATGEDNTFKEVDSDSQIDTFIRSRPVSRSVSGNSAIRKSNNLNLLDGLDFLTADNLPTIDFSHSALEKLSNREDILSMRNHPKALGGSGKNASITPSSTVVSPIVAGPDKACSKKTIDLATGKLIENTDVAAYMAGSQISAANTTGNTSDDSTVRLLRQGVMYSVPDTLNLIQIPTFDNISIDSNGSPTQVLVNDEGAGLRPNDIIFFHLTGHSSGGLYFLANAFVGNEDGSGGFRSAKLEFQDVDITADYTIYAAVVIPPNSLTQPIYDGDSTSNTEAKGFFPKDSLGDEFEISHRGSSKFPSTKFLASRSTFPFKESRFPVTPVNLVDAIAGKFNETDVVEPALSSEENLHCFVIRRTTDNEIIVYDRTGEIVARKKAGPETDGTLSVDNFGMVIGQPGRPHQQMRIARFGIVEKDLGDLLSRDIASQMFEVYKA
jgi:hypothetical protein